MYFSFIEQIDSWLENDSYEKEMTLRKLNSDLVNKRKKYKNGRWIYFYMATTL